MNVIPVNEKHKNIGCCPKCENKPLNRVSTLAQAPMQKKSQSCGRLQRPAGGHNERDGAPLASTTRALKRGKCCNWYVNTSSTKP